MSVRLRVTPPPRGPFARRRRFGVFGCLAALLVAVLLVGAAALLIAWPIMAIAGAFHSWWGWPALSYGQSIVVTLALMLVSAFFGRSSH